MLNRGGFIKEDEQVPDVSAFDLYTDAFQELSTCRKGDGPSPIPFTAIVKYAEVYDLGEDFEEFLYVIREMDKGFIKAVSEKTKSSVGKGSNNASGVKHSNKTSNNRVKGNRKPRG